METKAKRQRIRTGHGLSFLTVTLTLCLAIWGCSDDGPTDPDVGSDLEYVGFWSGTTSQGKPITITIETIDGQAVITRYTISAHVVASRWSADIDKTVSNPNGIATVSSGSFETSGLTGSFSSTTSISGEFSVSSTHPQYGDTAHASGTYSASR